MTGRHSNPSHEIRRLIFSPTRGSPPVFTPSGHTAPDLRRAADNLLLARPVASPRATAFDYPKMDWQGQKHAEILMQILLVASAVVAFLTGYLLADFQLMLFVYAAGVVLTALITVPNWPFFNLHPLKWLDPTEAERHPRPQVSNAAGTGGKKKSVKFK